MTRLWIGTYPAAGAGTPVGLGEGVWQVTLDDATGTLGDARLVVTLPSPSFVAASPDGRTLHAALEVEDGEVAALTVDDDGGLAERSRRSSGGAFPCHVSTDVDGLLAVANYASGTLGILPADPAAGDRPTSFGHQGSGPVTDRQESSHAHFVALAPGGRHLLVSDLGTDELRRYRIVDGGVEPDGIAATLPPGTGPRHLAFTADGGTLYVAGELDVQVHALAWDVETATATPRQTVTAVVGDPDGPGDRERADPVRHPAGSLPSHLVVDGDEVLVTVRGADVLTRYAIGPDGRLSDGRSHALGGHWPRHFAVVGPWVVVALERAHRLVVLDASGEIVSTLDLPSPTCVVLA